jgi:hypothetical protein
MKHFSSWRTEFTERAGVEALLLMVVVVYEDEQITRAVKGHEVDDGRIEWLCFT